MSPDEMSIRRLSLNELRKLARKCGIIGAYKYDTKGMEELANEVIERSWYWGKEYNEPEEPEERSEPESENRKKTSFKWIGICVIVGSLTIFIGLREAFGTNPTYLVKPIPISSSEVPVEPKPSRYANLDTFD